MEGSDYQIESSDKSHQKRPYHKITPQEEQNLLHEVFINGLSISKAAKKLRINNSTAKVKVREYKSSLKKKNKLHQLKEQNTEHQTPPPSPQVLKPIPQRIDLPSITFQTPLGPMSWYFAYSPFLFGLEGDLFKH